MPETTKERRTKKWSRGSTVLIVLLTAVALYLWSQVWVYMREGNPDGAGPEVLSQEREDLPAYDISGDTLDALRAKAKKAKRYKPLAKHPEYYPEDLLRQVLRNEEVLDFALGYTENVGKDWSPSDVALDAPKGIPHYLQWDSRWGYGAYGSSVVGVSGCGPTCLSMAVVGLTGNIWANPLAVAEYSDAQGWYIAGAGTDWTLMRDGAEHYGLAWQELSPEQDAMCRVLDQGGCIIASLLPGDFTASGHFVVISGYNSKGFQVLDPNSRHLSRTWTLEALKPQFAALWGYTA